jgi:hypothetical protein
VPNFFVIEGVYIDLYFHDHAPPHFHARYAEAEAIISIRELKTLKGSLPKSKSRNVMAWAKEHQTELMEIWDQLQH